MAVVEQVGRGLRGGVPVVRHHGVGREIGRRAVEHHVGEAEGVDRRAVRKVVAVGHHDHARWTPGQQRRQALALDRVVRVRTPDDDVEALGPGDPLQRGDEAREERVGEVGNQHRDDLGPAAAQLGRGAVGDIAQGGSSLADAVGDPGGGAAATQHDVRHGGGRHAGPRRDVLDGRPSALHSPWPSRDRRLFASVERFSKSLNRAKRPVKRIPRGARPGRTRCSQRS